MPQTALAIVPDDLRARDPLGRFVPRAGQQIPTRQRHRPRRGAVRRESAANGAEAVVRALSELQQSNQWYRTELDRVNGENHELIKVAANLSPLLRVKQDAMTAAAATSPASPPPLLRRLFRR